MVASVLKMNGGYLMFWFCCFCSTMLHRCRCEICKMGMLSAFLLKLSWKHQMKLV